MLINHIKTRSSFIKLEKIRWTGNQAFMNLQIQQFSGTYIKVTLTYKLLAIFLSLKRAFTERFTWIFDANQMLESFKTALQFYNIVETRGGEAQNCAHDG